MEWTSVAPYGGPARPAIVALLRRLEAAAGAPLPLRIGGASGEESWWNPSHRGPRPPGVRHDIDPATLAALAGLARGLDAPVTMGLNLQDGDDRNALALARAAQRRLGGRLEGLEIGNEPDLYTAARTFGPPAVRRLRKRVRYTPADYVRDAGRYLDALAAGLPARSRPRLVIGGFAGQPGLAADAAAAHRAPPGHGRGDRRAPLRAERVRARRRRRVEPGEAAHHGGVARPHGGPRPARRDRPRAPAPALGRRAELGAVRRRARRERQLRRGALAHRRPVRPRARRRGPRGGPDVRRRRVRAVRAPRDRRRGRVRRSSGCSRSPAPRRAGPASCPSGSRAAAAGSGRGRRRRATGRCGSRSSPASTRALSACGSRPARDGRARPCG